MEKAVDPIGILAAQSARAIFLAECEAKKMGPAKIFTRLKQALNAKKTQTVKLKGAVLCENLPRGVKVLCSSVEETILGIDFIDTRLRFDAAKEWASLLDLYPDEKHKISFDEETLSAILTGLPTGIAEAVRTELSRIISSKRD